jgi:hypothetical protein
MVVKKHHHRHLPLHLHPKHPRHHQVEESENKKRAKPENILTKEEETKEKLDDKEAPFFSHLLQYMRKKI